MALRSERACHQIEGERNIYSENAIVGAEKKKLFPNMNRLLEHDFRNFCKQRFQNLNDYN